MHLSTSWAVEAGTTRASKHPVIAEAREEPRSAGQKLEVQAGPDLHGLEAARLVGKQQDEQPYKHMPKLRG